MGTNCGECKALKPAAPKKHCTATADSARACPWWVCPCGAVNDSRGNYVSKEERRA